MRAAAALGTALLAATLHAAAAAAQAPNGTIPEFPLGASPVALTGDARLRPYLPALDERWRGTSLERELERAHERTAAAA